MTFWKKSLALIKSASFLKKAGSALSLGLPVAGFLLSAWRKGGVPGNPGNVDKGLDTELLINIIRRSGDFLYLALPISGLLWNGWQGRSLSFRRHSVAIAITAALTHAIKHLCNCTFLGRRPDGGELSFPSGHTSSAFSTVMLFSDDLNSEEDDLNSQSIFTPSTAKFILTALAMWTGGSRVIANKHHIRDVVVGAALPMLVSYGIKKLNCGFGLSDEECGLGNDEENYDYGWRFQQ